jgi:adenylate kinase
MERLPTRVVLMGMPGVGKGTQAVRLKGSLQVPHVSTGDILRSAVRAGSALGRRVKDCLDAGDLVPDDLMGELIAERLGRDDARSGFILDGFPRTRAQVDTLDVVLAGMGTPVERVVLLAADEDEIVRRLAGRRVCPGCDAVYHLETNPPASAGVCDRCGSALVQRPDDSERVVRDRLRLYREQTLPVAEAYRERGLLAEVDATGNPVEVFERIRAGLVTS